jgi:hypothetical protein
VPAARSWRAVSLSRSDVAWRAIAWLSARAPVDQLQRSKSLSRSGELAAKAGLICLVAAIAEMVTSKSVVVGQDALIWLVADSLLIIHLDAEPTLICLVAALDG